jgi:hypothetical protein
LGPFEDEGLILFIKLDKVRLLLALVVVGGKLLALVVVGGRLLTLGGKLLALVVVGGRLLTLGEILT